MFAINDDLSIYVTRGDTVFFTVSATDNGNTYFFEAGDVLRMKIYGKKDATNVVLEKCFPVTARTDRFVILLTEEDTKFGDVISKPRDYWYEIELNPFTNPQTIIGYDEDGPKVFRLFPEGMDSEVPEVDPEDIPVVDVELDMTSNRPVQNQAIARAIVNIAAACKVTETDVSQKVSDIAHKVAVEAARIDNFVSGATVDDAELTDVRVGADGKKYESAGSAVRNQIACLDGNIGCADAVLTISPIIGSVNKFNKADPRCKANTFLNASGYLAESKCSVTHPIYLKMGVPYKMPYDTDGLGENYYVALTDGEGNIESVVKGTVSNGFLTFTPENSGFAVFNVGYSGEDSFMVCEESKFPGEYTEYKLELPFMDYDINPLQGKIVTFNGDSICAGTGFSGGYGKIISEANGMVYENIGVGGGTITAEVYTADGEAHHWISRTISNMRNDADYVILEGGVNDAFLGIDMGAISEGYTAPLDDSTFYGAFESMLKQVYEKYPGKKIGYIAVHKMTDAYSSDSLHNYYHAAIECCKKWGVPVCDLNVECPPLNYFYSLRNTYTLNGDGWHPNEDGYRAYYVPKIEEWMKTL